MNEILRNLSDRFTYLSRRGSAVGAVAEQGLLTDELKVKISACLQKNELEDLYLPYRPKRRTRATIERKAWNRWQSSLMEQLVQL